MATIAFRAIGSGEVFADTPYRRLARVDVAADAARLRRLASATRRLARRLGRRRCSGSATPADAQRRVRAIVARAAVMRCCCAPSAETRERIAVFAPEAPARAALTRAVKAAFDPLGLFNPGRMWDGV